MPLGYPKAKGLYDPRWEHDACGVGAVMNLSGRREHDIIDQAKQVLLNLHHRGAAGSDETTGDGAGILFQVPHELFAEEAERLGLAIGESGAYGVGMIFMPHSAELRRLCEEVLGLAVADYGMTVLGWRDVPGDNSCLGELARECEPVIRQVFIDGAGRGEDDLEDALYRARKRTERLIARQLPEAADDFYIVSMSARTICYKGMFFAHQLFAYYPDLADPRLTSAMAVVHQRYSTNTFPSWPLAQPFRMLAHNGEINTISGNRNRMWARQHSLARELGEKAVEDIVPVLTAGASDSAQFDNAMEFLIRGGRSLPHSAMMMIPEAFGASYHISTDKRAFYEYHASIMEPWDGPAAMVFTDGRLVGGMLDRNGLRPARYVVTTDDRVVLASEAGVIDFPPEQVRRKGRLQPGRMFLVDTVEGRIITDNEIKSRIARSKPYRRWIEQNRIELRGLFTPTSRPPADPQELARMLKAFGYTREELQMVLAPMASTGQEPIGSMGNDAPLAVLSDRHRPLFNYFKQLFAQVTNPPIDPLREGLVMSLMSYTGKQRNVLTETPTHCRQLRLPHPILSREDLDRLTTTHHDDFKVATIDALFDVTGDPGECLRRGMESLLDAAQRAIEDGASLLIVTDRKITAERAAIPSLLAAAGLHHGLLRRGLRAEAGIVIDSGEPREVMHFALLVGFGANAICPYLGFDALAELRRSGYVSESVDAESAVDHYIAAIKKGILKTMSKMGISTLRSYQGAQLFEAIGLASDVVDEYFTGVASRIGGIGLGEIARETLTRHTEAFGENADAEGELDFGGDYHFRCDGEQHLWNPVSVTRLQHAVMLNDPTAYAEYAESINNQARKLSTLRGLFEFVRPKDHQPIELDQVEPASEIVHRFCTGAMSHGSISAEAHEAMAIAMNRIGAMSNTGEGGEDPARYKPMPGGDSKNSAIKQIASGRFGVTIEYLANARELQIKMAQGAKPGEGGQLPGHKVTEEIARLRHSTPDVTLISPPPHHDIYSIEDLAQLIYDLKCANPSVKVSVKLVAEVGVGTIAAGVAKGNADEVLISGHDGGTGASPLSSIKHAGIPWELGLAETQQVLVMNNLRDRIRVQVDGQLKTGRDVAIGAMLGAEQFGFGTAAIVSLGCVLMRKCHLGTCPAGIATQDTQLRKRFAGKPEHLERFMFFVAEEVRQIMAELGFRTLEEMVGRVDCLSVREAVDHWKARGLDFSKILEVPDTSDGRAIHRVRSQSVTIEDHLDWKILDQIRPAIEARQKVQLEMPIRNVNRTVGTILSNAIVKQHGAEGLADETVRITFLGSAGQSFGAFLAPGVTLHLIGEANDYLGKGLSGGRIILETPNGSPFTARDNIIAGNTLLYGATRGEVFINGLVGERFAVRNSGAVAVVEGVGDHGCEYMTGGAVIVLGQTGRNFAAGMSGGIAYVYDEHQLFDTLCNLDMVDLETVWQEQDKSLLRTMIKRHHECTGSKQAAMMLDNWRETVGRFVKVMPIDYRKALERLRNSERRSTEFTPATEEVFRG